MNAELKKALRRNATNYETDIIIVEGIETLGYFYVGYKKGIASTDTIPNGSGVGSRARTGGLALRRRTLISN